MLDQPQWLHTFDLPRTSKWRVELSSISHEDWLILDAGYIYGEYDSLSDRYQVVVEHELKSQEEIFHSYIKSGIKLAKQGNVILWDDPNRDIEDFHGTDGESCSRNSHARVAIVFQETPGCTIITEFIIHAISQSEDPRNISFSMQNSSFDFGNGGEDRIPEPLRLPPYPTAHNLTEIVSCICKLLKSSFGRDLFIVYLVYRNYLEKLWQVFDEVANQSHSPNQERNISPLERLQILWSTSDIVKQFFLTADTGVFEHLLDYENFLKILSILEFDRVFGPRKANFRKFYCEHTTMKQVVDVCDSPIIQQIQKTYRMQLIRDILVRSSDDLILHILHPFIYTYQFGILTSLEHSPEFCNKLFELFNTTHQNKRAPETMRDEGINFISEVMKTSKTLPFIHSKSLYASLLKRGLMKAITYGLHKDRQKDVKLMTLESLSTLLDLDSSLIYPFRALILHPIIDLVWNTKSEAPKSSTSSAGLNHLRTVQIEASEFLKKMVSEFSQDIIESFLAEVRGILGKAPSTRESLLGSRPILDVITHCFSINSETTCEFMLKYKTWYLLGNLFVLETMNSTSHTISQLWMSLIRLLREAFQQSLNIPFHMVSTQTFTVIESGLLFLVIRRTCLIAVLNDAESSSVLNLLHMVVDGRQNSNALHLKIITDWLQNLDVKILQLLCNKHGFVNSLLPDRKIDDSNTKKMLKRSSSLKELEICNPNHLERPVKSNSGVPIRTQTIDDVFVLTRLPSKSELVNDPHEKFPKASHKDQNFLIQSTTSTLESPWWDPSKVN